MELKDAEICIAEITLDNPNVWFELGFAIALKKEVVLLCSDERVNKFPFDVQHRTVLKYSTKSTRDYEELKSKITERIIAYKKKSETLSTVSDISILMKIEGLEQHEIVSLVSIAQNLETPEDNASLYQVRRDMEANGFTKIATILGIRSLLQKGLIKSGIFLDYEANEKYTGYQLTDTGWSWVFENKQNFILRKENKNDTQNEEEIPF